VKLDVNYIHQQQRHLRGAGADAKHKPRH